MGLSVSASGGSFPITPEGVYTARCFKIIDLGTQWVEWQGNKKEQHKVMVSWELLDDEAKMDDGKPFAATTRYTASLDERSRLRADLEAWRGKKFTAEELEAFDLKTVLGAYCTIQIVHSEDGKYANINSIMAFKGDKPKPVNPDVAFDIDSPDMAIYATFSDNLKEIISKAPEFRVATASPADQPAEEADDIQDLPAEKQGTAKAARNWENVGKGQKEDEVITDIGDEPINLADIPF